MLALIESYCASKFMGPPKCRRTPGFADERRKKTKIAIEGKFPAQSDSTDAKD